MVAITSYFNPVGYKRRLANYRIFRRHLDLPLLTIEWSPAGDFVLGPGDADVVVPIRSGDVLWQKERLLNLALNYLPPEVESVAWVDCDLIFERSNWSETARALLERYSLIQLFDEAVHLPPFPPERPLQPEDWLGAEPVYRQPGIAAAYAEDERIVARYTQAEGTPLAWLPGTRSAAPPAHGLAWAARRSVLETCRFYDACVMGGGDSAIFMGAIGRSHTAQVMLQMTAPFAEHYRVWAHRLHASAGRSGVGHQAGRVFHLWHGERADRRYKDRHALLAAANFDPARNLELTLEGTWVWSRGVSVLRDAVEGYLRSRQEDGRAPCDPA